MSYSLLILQKSGAGGYCTELQVQAQERHKTQEQRRQEEMTLAAERRDYHDHLTRAVEQRSLQREQSREGKLKLERKVY